MNANKKDVFVSFICVLFSAVAGILCHDFLLGGSILATGLLCAYFTSVGKQINYLFGSINYLVMAYAAYVNHLYGLAFFYTFVFLPLQVHGYLMWQKELDKDNTVKVREFTLKNSIIIVSSCVVGSFILAYILQFIPGQQLSFLDASSNTTNLCVVILMMLRFKEAWWMWLVNNVIDLVIWILIVLQGGENSMMMLLVSIGYLLINFYGMIKWEIKAKE